MNHALASLDGAFTAPCIDFGRPSIEPPLSGDHLWVDGMRVMAWALMKSFRPKAESTPPDGDPWLRAFLQVLTSFRLSDFDHDLAALNLRGIGPKIHAGRRAPRFACPDIENGRVLGAFDLVIHDQTAAQMDGLVGAKSIRAKDFIAGGAVDGESARLDIEATNAFGLNVIERANNDPVSHENLQVFWGRA